MVSDSRQTEVILLDSVDELDDQHLDCVEEGEAVLLTQDEPLMRKASLNHDSLSNIVHSDFLSFLRSLLKVFGSLMMTRLLKHLMPS